MYLMRNNMGRKLKLAGERAHTITFRGRDAERTAITLIAKQQKMDVAQFVRETMMAAYGDKITELADVLEKNVP